MPVVIGVCESGSCRQAGADSVVTAIEDIVGCLDLESNPVTVVRRGCLNLCDFAPNAVVRSPPSKPKTVSRLVKFPAIVSLVRRALPINAKDDVETYETTQTLQVIEEKRLSMCSGTAWSSPPSAEHTSPNSGGDGSMSLMPPVHVLKCCELHWKATVAYSQHRFGDCLEAATDALAVLEEKETHFEPEGAEVPVGLSNESMETPPPPLVAGSGGFELGGGQGQGPIVFGNSLCSDGQAAESTPGPGNAHADQSACSSSEDASFRNSHIVQAPSSRPTSLAAAAYRSSQHAPTPPPPPSLAPCVALEETVRYHLPPYRLKVACLVSAGKAHLALGHHQASLEAADAAAAVVKLWAAAEKANLSIVYVEAAGRSHSSVHVGQDGGGSSSCSSSGGGGSADGSSGGGGGSVTTATTKSATFFEPVGIRVLRADALVGLARAAAGQGEGEGSSQDVAPPLSFAALAAVEDALGHATSLRQAGAPRGLRLSFEESRRLKDLAASLAVGAGR